VPSRPLILCMLARAAPFALEGVATAHGERLKVVASGLDNPRGLDVGPRGQVYVAEAGRGGRGPCIPSPEGEGMICAGASGAVTKAWRGGQRRILSGLPSVASAGTGAEATGPQDVAVSRFGGAYVVVGLGADPARRPEVGPLGARLGRLYKLTRFGRLRTVADVAAFEAAANPDAGQPGAEVDSNPNSVTADRGRPVVADAGGNDLLRVGRRGRISTLAVFPYRSFPRRPASRASRPRPRCSPCRPRWSSARTARTT
jgi:hypothetical protein